MHQTFPISIEGLSVWHSPTYELDYRDSLRLKQVKTQDGYKCTSILKGVKEELSAVTTGRCYLHSCRQQHQGLTWIDHAVIRVSVYDKGIKSTAGVMHTS